MARGLGGLHPCTAQRRRSRSGPPHEGDPQPRPPGGGAAAGHTTRRTPMTSTLKRSAFCLVATTALVTGVAGTASAQPVDQRGLVNVNVGDGRILEDVNSGVAAQVAAQICGLKVGPVAVLGSAVDRSGETRTVCESAQGPATIDQARPARRGPRARL